MYKVTFRNQQPIGEVINVGPQYARPVCVICTEQCVRLAHKHAVRYQNSSKNQVYFQGFLIGTVSVDHGKLFVLVQYETLMI